MAVKYYNKLFKEYCIADMSRYKTGQIGLRWRTQVIKHFQVGLLCLCVLYDFLCETWSKTLQMQCDEATYRTSMCVRLHVAERSIQRRRTIPLREFGVSGCK